jgi:hypothetical protein
MIFSSLSALIISTDIIIIIIVMWMGYVGAGKGTLEV